MRSVRWGGGGGGGGLPPFLWEGRELPPFFNGREGMTSFFENPRLSSVHIGLSLRKMVDNLLSRGASHLRCARIPAA